MANATATKLVDTSIMHGVIEFATNGNDWRYCKESSGIWARYVKRGNAYVFDGRVSISGRATPTKLWDAS